MRYYTFPVNWTSYDGLWSRGSPSGSNVLHVSHDEMQGGSPGQPGPGRSPSRCGRTNIGHPVCYGYQKVRKMKCALGVGGLDGFTIGLCWLDWVGAMRRVGRVERGAKMQKPALGRAGTLRLILSPSFIPLNLLRLIRRPHLARFLHIISLIQPKRTPSS